MAARLGALIVLMVVAACAPMHIREHQAEGASGRCGYGSSGRMLEGTGLWWYGVDVSRVKDELVVSVALMSRDGESLTVLEPNMTLAFDGQTVSVPVKVSTGQVKRKDPSDHPREGAWSVGTPYVAREDGEYGRGGLTVEARVPFRKAELEVRTVPVKLNERLVPAQTVRYRFVDRWTIVPLNGC